MGVPNQLSGEEFLALLNAKARDSGANGDSFRMRIFRKRGIGQLAESVATLEGAQVLHFATPETWLPKLCGGGPIFILQAYHSSDPTTMIGSGGISYQIGGEARNEINFDAINEASWQGPKQLIYPDPKERRQAFAQQGQFSIPPSVPYPGATAPQSSVPTGLGQAVVSSSYAEQQLAFERNQLETFRRELENQKHQMEVEKIRAESDAKADARFRELDAKLTAQAQATALAQAQAANLASRPPEKDRMVEMLTVLAPVVAGWMQQQNAIRVQMMQQQQETAKQQQALVISMLEKKTEETPATKVFAQVAESMGSMMKLTTENMSLMMEMQNGPKDPPGLMVVKELVKGVNAVAQGMASRPQMRLAPKLPTGQQPRAAQPQAADAPRTPTSVDRIQAMIVAMIHPQIVASEFEAAIEDPDMVEALREVGGDPIALFQARLSSWVAEDEANRGSYVMQLANTLQENLLKSGKLTSEDEHDREEGEEDEDEHEEAQLVPA